MSSRQRKTAQKTQESPKAPRASPVRPGGKAPEAMVSTRHGTGSIMRSGRGFSLGELAGAGLPPRVAADWGARVDVRRRSTLDGNVNALKGWGARAASKPHEGGAKKLEEEVEKELKKEVVAVEKEVVKLEKEVKKGAAKAEKAVKAKARPKAKAKKQK